MSNQSNYAHERFLGDIKEVSKIKKINKSLMLLIMVGNMASIFTQVYIAEGDIHIQFLSSFAVYSTIYISFPFFEPMWTFSWLFSFAAVTGPMYSGASAFFF